VILYTTVPYELIFPPEEEDFVRQKTILYQGVPLIVEQTDSQTLQVVRVLSTDPQHFLDARYLPGTKISLLNEQGLS